MRLMRWAKQWQKREGWDHRLRVMLEFDAERVDYHREEVPLGRLARMWKSYIAQDAYERKESGRSTLGGRP